MTNTEWRQRVLAEGRPAKRFNHGGAAFFGWRPVYPLEVGKKLFELAESQPTPAEYEAGRARILEGVGS